MMFGNVLISKPTGIMVNGKLLSRILIFHRNKFSLADTIGINSTIAMHMDVVSDAVLLEGEIVWGWNRCRGGWWWRWGARTVGEMIVPADQVSRNWVEASNIGGESGLWHWGWRRLPERIFSRYGFDCLFEGSHKFVKEGLDFGHIGLLANLDCSLSSGTMEDMHVMMAVKNRHGSILGNIQVAREVEAWAPVLLSGVTLMDLADGETRLAARNDKCIELLFVNLLANFSEAMTPSSKITELAESCALDAVMRVPGNTIHPGKRVGMRGCFRGIEMLRRCFRRCLIGPVHITEWFDVTGNIALDSASLGACIALQLAVFLATSVIETERAILRVANSRVAHQR